MNRTQAQLFALKVSLLVSALLAVFVTVSVLDTRPESTPGLTQTLSMMNQVMRVPASIPNMLKESPKTDLSRTRFEVWKAPCLALGDERSAPPSLSTDSRWVRVSTGTCDGDEEITNSKLLNERNGYLATIFMNNHSHFTSDYIPLAEGSNPLHMEFTLASGRHVRYQWLIQRTPTVSN